MIPAISIVVLDWIIHFLHLTAAITIFLLAARFRFLTPVQKWVLSLTAVSLAAGLASQALYRNNINPNYAASVYYIIVVIFYAGFFVNAMDLGRYKRILFIIAGMHVIFSFCNLVWIQKETINTYSAISLSLIIISLCLFFFYSLLKAPPTDDLPGLPVFWFVTAEFLVNTGQMLMKSFAHFLINIFNDNLIILWVFHHGLGITGNLLYIYGAWLVFSRYRSKGSAVA